MNIVPTIVVFFFFFNDTATTEIYTLSLHDALPIYRVTHLLPLRSLPFQLLAPLRGQGVDPHPLLVLGFAPLGGDPSLTLEPVQGRVERAGVHLEYVV